MSTSYGRDEDITLAGCLLDHNRFMTFDGEPGAGGHRPAVEYGTPRAVHGRSRQRPSAAEQSAFCRPAALPGSSTTSRPDRYGRRRRTPLALSGSGSGPVIPPGRAGRDGCARTPPRPESWQETVYVPKRGPERPCRHDRPSPARRTGTVPPAPGSGPPRPAGNGRSSTCSPRAPQTNGSRCGCRARSTPPRPASGAYVSSTVRTRGRTRRPGRCGSSPAR